jgi:RHH-type proline utilization regulon transcriptional repressor/proline dehydrogenase/delta 1-pyrroline-5-carboxylate dehydrogenase
MPADRVTDLTEQAVDLARRWVDEAAEAPVGAAAARLAGMLRDPRGRSFTTEIVDGVLRQESLSAAASQLHRIAPLVPEFLPWYLRGAVQVGGAVAPVLPAPVVPLARRALREMLGHLVVDARPDKLGPALAKLRETGARVDLALLGEPVLGDTEARRRLDSLHALIRRSDVDAVSIALPSIAAGISLWAFDDMVERITARLLPLYLDAAAGGTLVTLDIERYADLDLTIAVFTRLLEEPRLTGLEAGIVLPTSLPDALPALRELTAWARQRVAAGGARITVRLARGVDLAAERADAILHGWAPATYDSPLDIDANHLRCLDEALRPDATQAVRIAVAGRDLLHIAHARILATGRAVQDAVEFELPLGVPPALVAAVAGEAGRVLLHVPVVAPDAFDVAIGSVVRRLEEDRATDESLTAAVGGGDTDPLAGARERHRAAVERSGDPHLPVGARRVQERDPFLGPEGPRILRDPADPAEGGLTQAVLGIARSGDEDEPAQVLFGGEAFVETAVYAPREDDVAAVGAPGFRNTADSDPALAATRAWAAAVLARAGTSTAGDAALTGARIADADALDAVVGAVHRAAESWGARPAAERAEALAHVARVFASRRGMLIEVAASETGMVFAEADAEVSRAIDLAAYYGATARELDRVPGAVFAPARVTVVAGPAESAVAAPADGVLSALAAGSGVVLSPAPRARRCAAVLAETLWDAGVPRDVLALVDLADDGLVRALVTHGSVERVLLAGSRQEARLFRSWRPDLPLLAQTAGKNAIVVMPSADLDLAASDIVRSAFAHGGQDRSAGSLAILVGSVARSRRFARQLVDATTSLRVGPAADPLSEVGPLLEPPDDALRWALTTLGEGERWLVQPRELDFGVEGAGRFWTPGIRTGVAPGSRFHRERFPGPVLGIMHASSLAQAIEILNAVDAAASAGLHTRHPDDLALWLDRVDAGTLFVNRGTTGAIVQRQPFGGGRGTSVGPGAKSGGPNTLIRLGSWRGTSGGPASSTLHLRGLDSRITGLIEAAQPSLGYEAFEWLRRGALSDAIAWDREFARIKDVSHLRVERNLLRYRPVDVAIRATGDAAWQAVLRVVVAGVRAGSGFSLSAPVGLPAAVRRALGELGVPVSVETDEEWIERIVRAGDAAASPGAEPPAPRPPRVRLVGASGSVAALHGALARALDGDLDVAVYADEVTTAGRIELLPFLREQAISITAHRHGAPDPWSADVI